MPTSRRSRRRPWGAAPEPLDLDRAFGGVRHETGGDGEWVVRKVWSGAKTYTCPGCNQTVPLGSAHVVAWRADSILGEDAALDARRHWHSSCWQARGRRRPH